MFSKQALIGLHFIRYSRKITYNDILLGIPTTECWSQEIPDLGDSVIKELCVWVFFNQCFMWSVSDPNAPGEIA